MCPLTRVTLQSPRAGGGQNTHPASTEGPDVEEAVPHPAVQFFSTSRGSVMPSSYPHLDDLPLETVGIKAGGRLVPGSSSMDTGQPASLGAA